MLRRTLTTLRHPHAKKKPQERVNWKQHILTEPPKPMQWRDPRVWNKDKTEMKSFDVPQWDVWLHRARSEDMNEALQPFMDMPQSLKDRRYDVPWWANPFGAWYLQNILSLEFMKLPKRTNAEKVALYRMLTRGQAVPFDAKETMKDDTTLIKKEITERWRKLEFGDRAKGYPCTYPDYIQFLNEWFKSLDEEGLQRLREHFDRKIRPLLAVMSHVDLMYLEALTQNTVQDGDKIARRIAFQVSLGTPEFFDMSKRLKYEINEDYKVRDELGPELFALWSKAPERWPPERLAKMYSLDFTLVRKILVWHHFKACYDACVEPDWTLPKRLFALEWIRDVRARQEGKFYGKFRFAEGKIGFYSDKFLFRDLVNRREASYANVWEMDDPYRFLQDEADFENYWGDNYDMYRRMFPEMTGKIGEPIQQYAQMPAWSGTAHQTRTRSNFNWLYAEIGINVAHEPLKKVETDPTNEKRRRFVIRQPDGSLRSAKMSEMRAFYWKEDWADFRFWAPHMEWGIQDTPDRIAFQEHHPDTADTDERRGWRMQSRPVKWFYESHYTRTGDFAGFEPSRHMDRNANRALIQPLVTKNPQMHRKFTGITHVYHPIPEA